MCFCRFVYGAGAGVLICTTPKMIEEIIPPHLMKKGFGMSTSLLINIAFFGCLLLGGGMPEDPKELAETRYWLIMFGVQIPILVLNIFLNTFIYTEDTIDFCIMKGDK
jgi:MFS family permease